MENPNSKANPIPTRLEPRSRRKPRPHPVLQEEILAHAGTAVAVLRRAMLDPKPFPISRIRAAGSLLDLALQIAARERRDAHFDELERLDPEKAALKRLADEELRILEEFTMHKAGGDQFSPTEAAVARKYAALVQEIHADKLLRLGKRYGKWG